MGCILGIESSCDETGVAIYCDQRGLVAHALHSQIAQHAQYGGVVPEIASRDHVRKLIPLVKQVLRDAGMNGPDLEAVAYTAGPGLIGALMVGASAANALAWSWQLPCIPVHHMEAHLLAPMMAENCSIDFPFLGLLVSGGHTMLVIAHALGRYEVIGQSVDDAVGEAFDKTAKILGLGYPGGPVIENEAGKAKCIGNTYPRPMLDRPGLDLSFSGLKTHTLLAYEATAKRAADKIQVAAEFQAAVVDTLVEKIRRALQATQLTQLVVSGGVSANLAIREALLAMADELSCQVVFPPANLCTDNGAMIAFSGFLHRRDWPQNLQYAAKVTPRWSIDRWHEL